MENKYYTPSIEEFHVGFEYEYKNLLGEYSKYQFNELDFISFDTDSIRDDLKSYLESHIKYGSIRVKYLDKEDIESLGFEHDQSTKDGSYFYSGTLMTENQWCINLKDFIVDIYDINGKSDFRFNGFVKNKSELKQILKMIGYESEQRD